MNSTYSLGIVDGILSHFPARNLYFRDIDGNSGKGSADDSLLHARVRSDDYFSTVATELDQVIQALSNGTASSTMLPDLERIVDEFIEVGKAYKLTPRR